MYCSIKWISIFTAVFAPTRRNNSGSNLANYVLFNTRFKNEASNIFHVFPCTNRLENLKTQAKLHPTFGSWIRMTMRNTRHSLRVLFHVGDTRRGWDRKIGTPGEWHFMDRQLNNYLRRKLQPDSRFFASLSSHCDPLYKCHRHYRYELKIERSEGWGGTEWQEEEEEEGGWGGEGEAEEEEKAGKEAHTYRWKKEKKEEDWMKGRRGWRKTEGA